MWKYFYVVRYNGHVEFAHLYQLGFFFYSFLCVFRMIQKDDTERLFKVIPLVIFFCITVSTIIIFTFQGIPLPLCSPGDRVLLMMTSCSFLYIQETVEMKDFAEQTERGGVRKSN